MKKHLSFFFFFLFFLNSISVAFASGKPEEKSLVTVVPDYHTFYPNGYIPGFNFCP